MLSSTSTEFFVLPTRFSLRWMHAGRWDKRGAYAYTEKKNKKQKTPIVQLVFAERSVDQVLLRGEVKLRFSLPEED
jgi:hypothetical protein